jgi:hypothetical protein
MMSEQAKGLRQDALGEDLPDTDAARARGLVDDDLDDLDLQAEDGEEYGEPLSG